jgi:hypothetical protein
VEKRDKEMKTWWEIDGLMSRNVGEKVTKEKMKEEITKALLEKKALHKRHGQPSIDSNLI